MTSRAKKKKPIGTMAVVNRRARYDYLIKETIEVGIVLVGTEVRSIRLGQASIAESYAHINKKGHVVLVNAHIACYDHAPAERNHDPIRQRQLLLHRREQKHLYGAIRKKGWTLVPLDMHFNRRGIAKISLALAVGRKKYDKRQKEKEKLWKRENRH